MLYNNVTINMELSIYWLDNLPLYYPEQVSNDIVALNVQAELRMLDIGIYGDLDNDETVTVFDLILLVNIISDLAESTVQQMIFDDVDSENLVSALSRWMLWQQSFCGCE